MLSIKTFIFKRPKRTIINILFIISLVSLFISFLATGTVILWKYYPKTVVKIDKIIPDFYGDNIRYLYKKAKESKIEEESFAYFSKLYNELEDISTLNKYYRYRQESAKWLIQYYQNQKKNNEALKIAKKWEQNYPYDFIGKFAYLDTLFNLDKNTSAAYIEKLFTKHQDIQEVKDKYITYLFKHNNYNKALKLSLKEDMLLQSKAKFKIFYRDSLKGFSEKQSVKYRENDYEFSQGVYSLEFNKKFNKLKGLRIDIDSIARGTIVSEVQVIINENKIDIANVNQLVNTEKRGYKVIGDDPYFIFTIPKQLQNYSGELNLSFTCKVSKSNIVSSKVLQNNEWQFFVDSGKDFNAEDSIHFTLSKDSNRFISNIGVDFKSVSKIRLDFPLLKGLNIDDFKIILNDESLYTKKDIIFTNGIKRVEKYLLIEDNDPSVTIKLRKQLDIKNIKIQVIFNGVKDE